MNNRIISDQRHDVVDVVRMRLTEKHKEGKMEESARQKLAHSISPQF
jgi:hypothetical protein